MKGCVNFRAARSEFREWPRMMVLGVRRVRRRVWISDSVVVTGARAVGVIPE